MTTRRVEDFLQADRLFPLFAASLELASERVGPGRCELCGAESPQVLTLGGRGDLVLGPEGEGVRAQHRGVAADAAGGVPGGRWLRAGRCVLRACVPGGLPSPR